jgi:hypothetical protein
MNSKPALEFSNAGLELVAMKLMQFFSSCYQASLGILIEIAYSFAIILTSVIVIYFVLLL